MNDADRPNQTRSGTAAQVLALAIHQRLEVGLAVAIAGDEFGVDDCR